MVAIEIKNVSKEFKEGITGKKVKALDDLSLEIRQGEVFGFLGPNGAGKSTAIKILINLIFPDSGAARIMGSDVSSVAVRKSVGYLPENPYFYDYLNAEELLWFGGKASDLHKDKIIQRSEMILKKVDLFDARKRPLRTYSKGMVQRAGLALSLIHDPDVVILDEPMSGLDPIGRKLVGDLIVELKSQGKTVFFSSHILTDIERFCDRAAIIIGGKLRVSDTVERLVARDGTLERVFLHEVERARGGENAC